MTNLKDNLNFKLIKKITKEMHLSRIMVGILILGVFFSSIITFARPRIVSKLTDNGLANKNFSIIIFLCVVLLICSVFEYSNQLIQIKIFVKINNQFVENMYRMVLNKILKAPYEYSQNRTSAEMLSTISSDISRLSLLIDRSSLMMLQFLFQILGGTVGLILIDWKVAIVLLIIMLIKQIIVNQLSKDKTKLTEKYISELQKFGTWFANQISGIIEIKLWNLYRKKECEFLEYYKKIPEINEKLEICDGIENTLEAMSGILLEIVIYFVCGYLVCKNEMSLGNLLAFISYAMYVSNPLEAFSNIPYIWAEIKPSAKRFMELLEWPEEELESTICMNQWKGDLELKKVCFEYDESHIVLKDIDLCIPEGSKIAIVGDNGSGKTTLINLLLGIILPNKGEICVGGKNIFEVGLSEWRNLFALVGQKPYLFQGTLKDNIDLYNEKKEKEIETIAMQLKIELNANHHKEGYSYFIHDNGTNLSGGEKQKIIFLRAFIKKFKIIILDEMLSNCDEESRRNIRNIVFDPELKKTVILISHYEEDIAEVDEVYELKNGVLSKRKGK